MGTYPVQDAVAALQHEADKPGAKTDSAPGGGFVLTSSDAPQSVYLAFPNSNYQIEVYDPTPAGHSTSRHRAPSSRSADATKVGPGNARGRP